MQDRFNTSIYEYWDHCLIQDAETDPVRKELYEGIRRNRVLRAKDQVYNQWCLDRITAKHRNNTFH